MAQQNLVERFGGCQVEHLLSGPQAQAREKAKQDLLTWLNRFQKIQICCDYDGDYSLLNELLSNPVDWQIIENKAVRTPDCRLHHALDDARAMKEAFYKPEKLNY